MTFGEIVDDIISDIRVSSTDTDNRARVEAYVNRGHQRILRDPTIGKLRDGTLTFSTEAGRSSYGFVQAMSRIDYLTQQSNNRILPPKSLGFLRQIDPGQTMTGTPTWWIDMGYQPVFRQPESTGLWAVSNAADTTQVVHVRGADASGDEVPDASVTLTGTTRVQIGTTANYRLVSSFTLTAAATGTVRLYDASTGGNELARLPPGRLSNKWKIGRLWPTPSAALDYVVDGQLAIYTMVDEFDVPMFPEEFHDVLFDYGLWRWYRFVSDVRRAKEAKDDFDLQVAKLRSYAGYPPNYHPRLANRPLTTTWNNLGGWYPGDGTGE